MTTQTCTGVDEKTYRQYLRHLLQGDLRSSRLLTQRLLLGGTPLMCVYVDLLQRAMYEVGDLWAAGRISVAVEHMASAQTVDIMRMGFPLVPSAPRNKRKVIISCTAGENHVMGSHMVADLMELQGWDVISLGADTPLDSLVLLAEQMRPDLLGLSVTMPSNLPALYETIHTLRQRCGNLPIMVGGQALSLANQAELPSVTALRRVQSVSELAEL